MVSGEGFYEDEPLSQPSEQHYGAIKMFGTTARYLLDEYGGPAYNEYGYPIDIVNWSDSSGVRVYCLARFREGAPIDPRAMDQVDFVVSERYDDGEWIIRRYAINSQTGATASEVVGATPDQRGDCDVWRLRFAGLLPIELEDDAPGFSLDRRWRMLIDLLAQAFGPLRNGRVRSGKPDD